MTRLLLAMLLWAHAGTVPAAETLEIPAYWNASELNTVFNFVASVFNPGHEGFRGMIKLLLLVALGAAMMASAFMYQKAMYVWNWMFQAMILYLALMFPYFSVTITDRTAPLDIDNTPKSYTVNNVPVMLALSASVTAKLGDAMTTWFEGGMSVVHDIASTPQIQFRNNDLGFGHRLLRESRRAVIADPELRRDLVEYVRNCVNPSIHMGFINARDLSVMSRATADDAGAGLLDYLANNVNRGLMTTITVRDHPKDGTAGVTSRLQRVYCGQVFSGESAGEMPSIPSDDTLTKRIEVEHEALMRRFVLDMSRGRYTPNEISSAVATEVMGNLDGAFQLILGASRYASDSIKQNMVINLMRSSGFDIATALSDPAAAQRELAAAQAAAAANSSYITMGLLAEEAMPKIRNLIQIVIFSFFPLVVVFALVAGDRGWHVLKPYVMAMVWVELWAPIYAVIHYVFTYRLAQKLKTMALSTDQLGFSLANADLIGATALSDQALMGYMVILVPVIATALVKGGEITLSGVAQQLFAPVQQQGATVGAGVGVGNVSHGSVNMDSAAYNNVSAHKTVADVETRHGAFSGRDRHGNTVTTLNGLQSVQAMKSDAGAFGSALGKAKTSELSQSASNALTAAETNSVAATEKTVSGLSRLTAHGTNRATSQDFAEGWGEATNSRNAQTYGNVKASSQALSQRFGITEGDAAAIIYRAALGLGLGKPAGDPDSTEESRGSKGRKLPFSAEASGTRTKNYNAAYQEADDNVRGTMSSDTASDIREFARAAAHDKKFQERTVSAQTDRDEVAATFSEARERTKTAQASLTQAQSLMQQARQVEQETANGTYQPLADPHNSRAILTLQERQRQLMTQGMNPDAAGRMAISEFVDRTTTTTMPNTYLDGSAVHSNAQELRGLHESRAANPKFNENLAGSHTRGVGQTGFQGTTPVSDRGLKERSTKQLAEDREHTATGIKMTEDQFADRAKQVKDRISTVQASPTAAVSNLANQDTGIKPPERAPINHTGVPRQTPPTP